MQYQYRTGRTYDGEQVLRWEMVPGSTVARFVDDSRGIRGDVEMAMPLNEWLEVATPNDLGKLILQAYDEGKYSEA